MCWKDVRGLEKSFSDCGAVFGWLLGSSPLDRACFLPLSPTHPVAWDYGSLSGQLSPAGPIIIIITRTKLHFHFIFKRRPPSYPHFRPSLSLGGLSGSWLHVICFHTWVAWANRVKLLRAHAENINITEISPGGGIRTSFGGGDGESRTRQSSLLPAQWTPAASGIVSALPARTLMSDCH